MLHCDGVFSRSVTSVECADQILFCEFLNTFFWHVRERGSKLAYFLAPFFVHYAAIDFSVLSFCPCIVRFNFCGSAQPSQHSPREIWCSDRAYVCFWHSNFSEIFCKTMPLLSTYFLTISHFAAEKSDKLRKLSAWDNIDKLRMLSA